MFKNKILLITGGTGSFGNAVLRSFLNTEIKEIRIFSRDELKQDNMRKKYNNDKLKFYIGDVRDINSLEEVMQSVDFVFHAAALKQVPSCEFYPMQAVQTNILGTENVLNVAIRHKVRKIIVLSTDKAVYPINAMGISKAMMEKIVIAKSKNLNNNQTTICCTRYGNVIISRGSVIPLFVQQIQNNIPFTITDFNMTRFIMSLDEAIDLVMFAFKNGKNGDIFVKKSPATTIRLLVDVLAQIFNKPNHPIEMIGIRHGEKLHETLLTKDEMRQAISMKGYYKIPFDSRDLNYNGNFIRDKININRDDYSSQNAKQLTKKELKDILLKEL